MQKLKVGWALFGDGDTSGLQWSMNKVDKNGNGMPDVFENDLDGDGVPGVRPPVNIIDRNGSGVPDLLENDSDGDGLPGAKPPIVGGLDKKLLEELERSSEKYNRDDIIMITKTPDGKLVWLEKGNLSTGLEHILARHTKHFSNRGITDILWTLSQLLKSNPNSLQLKN